MLENHNELNSIKALHIHSDETDNLTLDSIADEFLGSREDKLRDLENLISVK